MANTGRLTDIVRSRRSQGASATGALAGGIKDRLKEKFDPRQLINQRGLLTALFPGLKAYQAKAFASEISKSSMQSASFDEIKPSLETISFNTKMTAKNTMVLPALHRDVNVIRQNIIKMVKTKGDARTKADMYFVNAKEREEKYERELKKERSKGNSLGSILLGNTSDGKKGFFGMLINAIETGLKTLTNGIAALGKIIVGAFSIILKTIIGAFQVIANVIVEMFSSLLSLLAGPLALIKTLLTDFIGLFFKKFLDFTKNKLLFSVFLGMLRGVVVGILNFLFSKNFANHIKNMAYGLLVVLGIFETADLYRRSTMYQDFFNEGDETKLTKNRVQGRVDDLKARRVELLEKSELPTTLDESSLGNLQNEGLIAKGIQFKSYLGKTQGMALNSKKMNIAILPSESVEYMDTDAMGATTVNTKGPSLLNDYAENLVKKEKRKLYQVLLPGFKNPVTLALTKEEAEFFGNNDVMYRMLLDALDAETMKPNPNEGTITSLIQRIAKVSRNSGIIASQLVNAQYNQNHPEFKYITEALRSYIKDENATISSLIMSDMEEGLRGTWDSLMNSPEIAGESEKFLENIKEEGKKKLGEFFGETFSLPNMLQLKSKLDGNIQNLKNGEVYNEMRDLIRQNYDAARQGVKDAIETQVNEVDTDSGGDDSQIDISPASALNHSWFLADYDGMNEMFGYGGKAIYG